MDVLEVAAEREGDEVVRDLDDNGVSIWGAHSIEHSAQ